MEVKAALEEMFRHNTNFIKIFYPHDSAVLSNHASLRIRKLNLSTCLELADKFLLHMSACFRKLKKKTLN